MQCKFQPQVFNTLQAKKKKKKTQKKKKKKKKKKNIVNGDADLSCQKKGQRSSLDHHLNKLSRPLSPKY